MAIDNKSLIFAKSTANGSNTYLHPEHIEKKSYTGVCIIETHGKVNIKMVKERREEADQSFSSLKDKELFGPGPWQENRKKIKEAEFK